MGQANTESHQRQPPATSEGRIRLHITPLTSDLLDRVIPPAIQPNASDISFHTLQTFPERGFGYVELPAMDAQKVKKKLHGSVLKGAKVRVQEARKRKSESLEKEATELPTSKKVRKAKPERGVQQGYELEAGRKIKRGWTDDEESSRAQHKAKKTKKTTSDVQEAPQEKRLRFKTDVPPNRMAVGKVERNGKSSNGEQKKKMKKNNRKKVVEEYSSRKKTADIDMDNGHAPGSVKYEEGKGWVDEEGRILEAESKRRGRPASNRPRQPQSPSAQIAQHQGTGSSGTESVDSESDPGHDAEQGDMSQAQDAKAPDENEVHPLEALFKRPSTPQHFASTPKKSRPAPINTSAAFTFFSDPPNATSPSSKPEDEAPSAIGMPPATPFTKQDMEWRSVRSAAPTPDTAAIGRKFALPFRPEDEDEDEERDEEGEVDTKESAGTGTNDGESTFRKWFYEHRGEVNRGWKQRRREERKVVRQRNNKDKGRKIA